MHVITSQDGGANSDEHRDTEASESWPIPKVRAERQNDRDWLVSDALSSSRSSSFSSRNDAGTTIETEGDKDIDKGLNSVIVERLRRDSVDSFKRVRFCKSSLISVGLKESPGLGFKRSWNKKAQQISLEIG